MDMRFSLEVELMELKYGLGMRGWQKVDKDDFQVSGISNWVIGAIYQDEKSWGSDQVWGI